MFAVLKTGGKQYRVNTGDVLRVEKLAAQAGETVQFNDVLMVGTTVGTPMVDGAAVQAEVVDQIKGDKVIHFVKRRRKHSSKRTKGHRQQLTVIKITEILESGGGATGVKAAIGAGAVAASATVAVAATTTAKQKPSTAKKTSSETTAADKTSAPKKAAATPEGSATAVRPANLLEQARDGGPDDLKRISGVGPKLEGLLHQNGVFHFDQIAAWNAGEVAYMDDQLSFKGRIDRDNWIEQAASFAAEKE